MYLGLRETQMNVNYRGSDCVWPYLQYKMLYLLLKKPLCHLVRCFFLKFKVMFCQQLLDRAEYKAYKHHFDTATALLFFHRVETWVNETDSTASSADA